jgi:hypothetical protein
MTAKELAREQIDTLPDEAVREVLDFIGYLKQRADRAEWKDLMRAQEAAMADVWDSDEDEVWNDL